MNEPGRLIRRKPNFAILTIPALLFITALTPTSAAGETISLLSEGSSSSAPFSFASIGMVPNARRVAVPETGRHVLVLTAEGGVWSWGDNSNGQLGSGTLTRRDGWASVEDLSDVGAIAAGTLHSIALKNDGTLWTW